MPDRLDGAIIEYVAGVQELENLRERLRNARASTALSQDYRDDLRNQARDKRVALLEQRHEIRELFERDDGTLDPGEEED